MAVVHFLLMFDHRLQHLVDLPQQFSDGEAATAAYARLEAAHRYDRELEIVLVGADSIETVMRTHGHYFRSAGNPLSDLALAR